MRNYNMMFYFVLLILLRVVQANCFNIQEKTDVQEQFEHFSESFIRHYEFNPEGRYTHEYHPFLLEKTANSLDKLEQRLKGESFALKGRIVIVGYEENAVPSYYTDYRQSRINDEAMVKNNVGWSMRLHNRFGFMTGFLFKDFNKLANYFFPKQDYVFEHIDADQIGIFDDRASVFHEHAFGQAYPLVQSAQASVMKKFKERKFLDIFADLVKFWQIMYDQELKVGNKQVAGTQDILFSIEYARHLLSSNLPFFSYFTGPDITYPIEITCKHDKYVSRHAQTFVHRLFEKLQPVEDKKTVYIFCSFVDGVGKSTTLGNIKNAMKHGNDVDNFEHVDNSSSQLAEVFQCKDNVFIADLPAQMSHFTYKPDGLVYVDARTEFEQEYVWSVIEHFKENKAEYLAQYQDLLEEVSSMMQSQGSCARMLHDVSNPEYAFIKNVLLLKRQSKKWIPFSYEGKQYLIREVVPTELRVLVPLGNVKSEGLKNIEAEQMLFFDGIRLPLPYEHFLQDLVAKLKQEDIQNIVFVDFMSMYPRSSRENVRINYLLQQMAHLNEKFNPTYSLYKDFVSCGELLSHLLEPRSSHEILQSFELEVLVRFALFRLIIERQDGGIDGLTVPVLTELIQKKMEEIGMQGAAPLRARSSKKLEHEKINMKKIFGLTKDFINIQCFSFQKAAVFSDLLQEFFTTIVADEKLNNLWQDDGKKLNAGKSNNLAQGPLDVIMRTIDGKKMRVLYKFSPECRTEQLLASFFKDMRVFWYAALWSLLDAQEQSDNRFGLKTNAMAVPPVYIKEGTDGNFYAVQRYFEPWSGDAQMIQNYPYELFNLSPTARLRYGQCDDTAYRLDWKADVTNRGLLGFCCDLAKVKKRGFYVPAIFMIAQRYQNEHGTHCVIPASKFMKKLKASAYWKSVYRGWKAEAEKNSRAGQQRRTDDQMPESWITRFIKAMPEKNTGVIKRPIIWGTKEQRPIIMTLVRLLATLEMIIKDPDANIVVRSGNRKDFKAALKLYERVVLPYFFGIIFKEPLFDDYSKVEPYPDWGFWEDLST